MGTKNTLISLFGKSPLRPIQEHMKVAASASSQLPIFLESCFAGDWDSAKTTRKYINEREAAAELGAATTVVLASRTGLPISTTHTLVGAVLGVGMARGIAAINLRTVGSIFLSWIITLPAGASLSILFFLIFRGIFS